MHRGAGCNGVQRPVGREQFDAGPHRRCAVGQTHLQRPHHRGRQAHLENLGAPSGDDDRQQRAARMGSGQRFDHQQMLPSRQVQQSHATMFVGTFDDLAAMLPGEVVRRGLRRILPAPDHHVAQRRTGRVVAHDDDQFGESGHREFAIVLAPARRRPANAS